MKLVRNAGTERVIDLIRPWLAPGNRLDVVTPAFSLFAFGEIQNELSKLAGARVLLPKDDGELGLLGTQKSVYEDVVCDMGTEREFAQRAEDEMSVKVYAKLPGWFQIPTPLGSYNPDWAVLIEAPDGERLYFVVETKGSLFGDDLRKREAAKIECGRAHFNALKDGDSPAEFRVASKLDDLLGG